MKNRSFKLLGIAMILAFIFAFSQSVVKAETVVLVYKTTLHADIHKENSSNDFWKYYVDTYKYYNIIEFDPVNRTFGKEYVISYYGKNDKVQKQEKGMTYKELKSYESEDKFYMKGTLFTTSTNDVLGDVRMKYGSASLKNKIDIGWSGGKVAIVTKLRDKIVNRSATKWEKFSSKSYSCKLSKVETKKANQNSLSAKEVFENISKDLYEKGYKPQLTL